MPCPGQTLQCKEQAWEQRQLYWRMLTTQNLTSNYSACLSASLHFPMNTDNNIYLT